MAIYSNSDRSFIGPPSPFSPYFYIIQHIPSGRYYAGYKAEIKTCDSRNLMTEIGYRTSSKSVKLLIKTDGLSTFKVRKIKHFIDALNARDYEYKFLIKIDAARNPKWLNKRNGWNTPYSNPSIETKTKMSLAAIGRIFSDKHRANLSLAQYNRFKLNPVNSETKKRLSMAGMDRIVSAETRAKNSRSNSGKRRNSVERRAQISRLFLGKKLSPEHKMNISKAGMNKQFSLETRAKMRASARLFNLKTVRHSFDFHI